MIIAVTGTPGTGKTSAAKCLADLTGMKYIGLNELARLKRLYSGYDRKRRCRIVNVRRLRAEVKRGEREAGNLIVESHYSHEMDPDITIVLTASPEAIRSRGRKKGWRKEKTEENVEAEIMEICRAESAGKGKPMTCIDTTDMKPEQTAHMMAGFLQEEGLFLQTDLKIPESMKDELRRPYGILFHDIVDAVKCLKGCRIMAVGDFVSQSLFSLGIEPAVFVADGLVRRKPFRMRIRPSCRKYGKIKADNPPGCLTQQLWASARKALQRRCQAEVEVSGEEDMAVIPFVLMGKTGDCVMYGLFGRGACVIRIDDDSKSLARNILKKMVALQPEKTGPRSADKRVKKSNNIKK